MKHHLLMLARYNLWATRRLWQHVNALRRLDDARLAGSLSHDSTKGVPSPLPFVPTLTHVFNHGTHHRGQITAMGHACSELDLLPMLREEVMP